MKNAGAQPRPTSQQHGPSLSLVVPAYNESPRIQKTIATAAAWLCQQPYRSELIVVDDGSSDETALLAEQALANVPDGYLVRVPHGGKAAAVRAGMLSSTMEQIAFSDADLATPLEYLNDLRAAVEDGADVAIGSREGKGAGRIGEPPYRHLMGRVFNGLVRVLLVPGIHDTQCGFKLFRASAARDILRRSRLYAGEPRGVSGPRVTAFDVELLVIARVRGYRIAAVPVLWTYGEGSKVRPAHDTWHNLRDVVHVWIDAKRGRYQ
jgi:dolichyl-phosphate beta-glucosyltransferase